MSVSRVKVGLPLDSPRAKVAGAMKWSASPRPRREAAPRLRLERVGSRRPAVETETAAPQATPDISAAPLTFLSSGHFAFLAGLVVLVLLLVWGMVQSNHQAVAYSYELSALTQEKLRVLEVNRQLKAELARIGSLDQLEIAAREKAGLITPKQGQIVVID